MNKPLALDEFVEGTTLANVAEVYDFDRRLRLLTLDALERVEVAVRFQVGHTLGRRGAFAHTDVDSLSDEFAGRSSPPPALAKWKNSAHASWLGLREKEEGRSKADFVKHFKKKYGLPLPVWVVTELLDFGGLSRLYAGLLQQDRDSIAATYGLFDASNVGHGGALQDWLKNLNYIRNVCAHHSRFWNVNVTERMSPRMMKAIPEVAHIGIFKSPKMLSRPYASLAVLALMTVRINPQDDWRLRLRNLVADSLPVGRREAEMGFPEGWRDFEIWN
ncbi:Abi family protein [Corynebacterium halotolerans]|uniref:Abi family protein n=1 Tax=Corynebacterium halotolerans TaxID=225326 RepID=UPI003CE74646